MWEMTTNMILISKKNSPLKITYSQEAHDRANIEIFKEPPNSYDDIGHCGFANPLIAKTRFARGSIG